MEAAPIDLVLASASPRRRELLERVGLRLAVAPVDVDETPRPEEPPMDYVRRMAATKCEAAAPTAGEVPVLAADTIVVVDRKILGKPRNADEAREMLRLLAGRRHEVTTAYRIARGASHLDPAAARGASHLDPAATRGVGAARGASHLDPATARGASHLDSATARGAAAAAAARGASHLDPARDAADLDRAVTTVRGDAHLDRAVTTVVAFRLIAPAELDAYIESGEWQDKAGGYAVQGIAAVFVTDIRGSYTNVVGLPLAEVVADLRALEALPAYPPPAFAVPATSDSASEADQ